MVILVDKEGHDSVIALCDIALKVGGVQNLNKTNQILSSMRMVPPQINKKPDEQDGDTSEEEKSC